MSICDLEVSFNESFYRKLSDQVMGECVKEALTKTTKDAEKWCRKECPVDTGYLRDHHTSEFTGTEGVVRNPTEYLVYVVFGTCKMAPNNYVERVGNKLISEDTVGKYFDKALKRKGVTE